MYYSLFPQVQHARLLRLLLAELRRLLLPGALDQLRLAPADGRRRHRRLRARPRRRRHRRPRRRVVPRTQGRVLHILSALMLRTWMHLLSNVSMGQVLGEEVKIAGQYGVFF